MPAAELGDVVEWAIDERFAEPELAIVTRVNDTSCSVSVLPVGQHNLMPYEGCRHFEYPDKNNITSSESGCWRHLPSTVAREERIAALEELIQGAFAAAKPAAA